MAEDTPSGPPPEVETDLGCEPVELAAATSADPSDTPAEAPPPVGLPPERDVHDLDWAAVRAAVDPAAVRARMRATVEAFETLLDSQPSPGLLFDEDRSDVEEQVVQVAAFDSARPLWIIGDLHGDLLTLEAALALADLSALDEGSGPPDLLLLGDLFDDEGLGLELLLRVFELIITRPGRVCVIVGNHDEALTYDGIRFASTVSPSDFADFLNANLAHEWIERTGKLAVRFFAQAPPRAVHARRAARGACGLSAGRSARETGGDRGLE